jgi:3'-phosphoadenosine 5'-phosphosulfate sulfotransferase (PAPS reductase)/FAD synthetase
MVMTLLEKIDKARKLTREYQERYPKHSFAFSGGKDSTVLLHVVCSTLDEDERVALRVDAILSDTEFDETHDFIDEFSRGCGVTIRTHFYTNDSDKPGDASKENKTEKFREVLADVDCWFSGIRRDEGAMRTEIQDVEERDGLVKVNPIADFTERDVWRYLAMYRVPVNKAYAHGYRSLSCKLSSEPEQSGDEGERDGRWRGNVCQGGECGIHSQSLRRV